jgi:hypothetical protein
MRDKPTCGPVSQAVGWKVDLVHTGDSLLSCADQRLLGRKRVSKELV